MADQFTTNISGGQIGAVNSGSGSVTATITDSFNNANQSNASAEMKSALKELSEQIQELVKHLPPDAAKQAADDYKSLADEAAKPEPRKNVVQVFAENLVAAAKNVADFAAPVATAVKAVLAIAALF